MTDTRETSRAAGVVNEALGAAGAQQFRRDPCGALYAAAQAHPGETIRLTIGDDRMLILQSAEPAGRVLREHEAQYRKNFGAFNDVFGNSRLTADGETWQRLRNVTQSAIAGREPERIAAASQQRYEAAASRLLDVASEDLLIDRPIDRAAAGVLLDVAFGLDVDALPDRFFDDLRSALDYCAELSWWIDGPPPTATGTRQALARTAWRRARQDMADMLVGGPRSGDDELVGRLFDNEAVAENVIGEFTTLLFAGSETTAAAIGWLIFLLAAHPDLQERLRSEVRELEVADMDRGAARLPALAAFINEGLRIFPPIPILSRVAKNEDELGEARVEPGDKVIISVIGLHHDSGIWQSPAELMPARFAEGALSVAQRRSFLPFSDGPRLCGGMRFAMVELPVALATLLRRIRFGMPTDRTVAFTWSASLRRAGGQRIAVAPL